MKHPPQTHGKGLCGKEKRGRLLSSPPLSAVLWDAQAMMIINKSTVEVELSFPTTKSEKKFIKAHS